MPEHTAVVMLINAPYNDQAPYNYPGNNYQYNNQPTKQNNGLSIASPGTQVLWELLSCSYSHYPYSR